MTTLLVGIRWSDVQPKDRHVCHGWVWGGLRHESGFKRASENPADGISSGWRLAVSQRCVSFLKRACSLMSRLQEKPGLPLCRKVCYAVGGIPYQMTGNALGFFLQIFLLDVVRVSGHVRWGYLQRRLA